MICSREYLQYAKKRKINNYIMLSVMILCTVVAILPLLSILGYIAIKGFPGLNLSFLVNLPAPVGEPGGGVGNAILGTVILVSMASVIGISVGVLTAIYLSEYNKEGIFASAVRFVADMLLGIPSIVVGIFAYIVVVLPIKKFTAISGGFTLGIMMIPIIIRSTEEMLNLVPVSIREAALALGMRKWKVIISVVLPSAMKGIITSIMLGIARVAGETAPLLLTAFGNHFWNTSLLQPIAALPLQIFTYAISPFDEWHIKAWAGALLLIMMILSINITARLLTNRRGLS